MSAIIDVVLPIFGVVLAGYLVGRLGIIKDERIDGLADFTFFVAIPALMFRSVVRSVRWEGADPGVLLAYFGASVLLFGLMAAIGGRAFRARFEESAVLGLAVTFGNSVQLGIPLVFRAFGESGMLPLMLIISFHSIVLIGLATVLVEIGRGRGGGPWAAALQAAKGSARNPIIIAMSAGLLGAAFEVELPQALDDFLGLIGSAGIPCALFALGAQLTRFRLAGSLGPMAAIVVVKLLVLPAIVWVFAIALGLRPETVAVATLAAGLPTGANVFILANRYQVYQAPVASAVVASTALSLVTVAALIAWLAPHP
ncbi:MAG: AEC family transporter [Alphaproteobacteria bacterium]|nr:AEC family transporter [Alphaproteobacteria bacterium]